MKRRIVFLMLLFFSSSILVGQSLCAEEKLTDIVCVGIERIDTIYNVLNPLKKEDPYIGEKDVNLAEYVFWCDSLCNDVILKAIKDNCFQDCFFTKNALFVCRISSFIKKVVLPQIRDNELAEIVKKSYSENCTITVTSRTKCNYRKKYSYYKLTYNTTSFVIILIRVCDYNKEINKRVLPSSNLFYDDPIKEQFFIRLAIPVICE